MANVSKYNRAATGQLCQHYERKKGEDGQYIKFGNQDIDLSKTGQNYNLAPHREGGQINFIRKRTSVVKCLNRSDVNVMCSWVVTLPKTFPLAKEREFFRETYRFLAERYGEKNVVSAYVHRDENQPHVHFAFIPVTIGKNGKEKVSAKEVLTKAELTKFHPDLQRDLEQHFGFEVEILNGSTAGGNRTMQELKAQRAKEQAEAVCTEYEHQINGLTSDMLHTQEQVEQVHDELDALKNEKNAVESEIDGLQHRLLTAKEVEAITGKKTLTGALRGVEYAEFEALKRTAVHVDTVQKQACAEIEKVKEDAASKIGVAETRTQTYKNRAEGYRQRAAKAEQDRPSLKLQMANALLRGKLERMDQRLRECMTHLPAEIQVVIQNILNDREPHNNWRSIEK